MPELPVGGAAFPARLLRRNGVYAAALLMDCALGFATVGSGYLAGQYGAGPARLGLLSLVSAGSYVVFCLVFGPCSDRWGRRRLVVLGAALDAYALILVAGAGQFWEICVSMGLFSAGQGAFWPALEADIADHSTPLELPRRLGRFNVAWCLGLVVGMPVAGAAGELIGQHWGLLIGSGLALLALAVYLLRTFEPEGSPGPAPDQAAERRAASRAVPFWTIALILNFAAMGLSSTLRGQMAAVTGSEKSALGGLYGALFFSAQVVVFGALGLWRGWHYRAAPLVAGSALAVGGAMLCGWFQAPPVFATGCAIGGIGCGVAYCSSIYYSVAAASARGHRGGIHEAVLGAGGAVVPFAGGLLAAAPWLPKLVVWRPGVPFLLAGAVLAVGFLAAAPVYLRARKAA
jgi:MFS family permease